jgi:hypothetical protein
VYAEHDHVLVGSLGLLDLVELYYRLCLVRIHADDLLFLIFIARSGGGYEPSFRVVRGGAMADFVLGVALAAVAGISQLYSP